MDERNPETGRFLTGSKGGPGRPKGARNKLGEAFIADLHEAWEALGMSAILDVIATKPADFLKVVASLQPKQLEVKTGEFDELSDEELASLLQLARAMGSTGQQAGAGGKPQGGQEPTPNVPSVH